MATNFIDLHLHPAMKPFCKSFNRKPGLNNNNKNSNNSIWYYDPPTIAEVLNRNNMYAWGIQYIGSDYDGLVDPLNGYWTAEDMPLFDSYLEKHAYNFLASSMSDDLKDFNRMKASDIVERFMHGNAYHFLSKNFN